MAFEVPRPGADLQVLGLWHGGWTTYAVASMGRHRLQRQRHRELGRDRQVGGREYPKLNNKPALMRAYKSSDLDHDSYVNKREFPVLLRCFQCSLPCHAFKECDLFQQGLLGPILGCKGILASRRSSMRWTWIPMVVYLSKNFDNI